MSCKFFFLSAALILSLSFSATVLWFSAQRWPDPNTYSIAVQAYHARHPTTEACSYGWDAGTGLLVNSVEQASSHDASIPQYQKLDNAGFTYHSRSYGVASTVGLVEPERSEANAKSTIPNYTYLENGYAADVSCSYNKSSRLAFYTSDRVTTPGGIYAPQGYSAQGSLPNGVCAGFPTRGVLYSDFVTALAAVRSPSRYMYGFVAGKSYSALNQTQCELTFTPASFKVAVGMKTKNISVTRSYASEQSLSQPSGLVTQR
ncbi:hypothetical protein B0J13DRAFT_663493 [Dactylonectria estremocensis]|uniref:Secreted protein n=1 Tax=Dactylonectria estremocensis TaxID=1079267 RepID=A0A9P9F180_9HYPO|nr:hypothetical protein B0J13DRAFT_663493 [Dactylonectria estremocensis]